MEYITNGFVEPLNSYIDKWDGVEQCIRVPEGTALPLMTEMYTPFLTAYMKEHYSTEKTGLKKKISLFPKTWDELYNAAVELTDPSQNRYGYSFRGGAGTTGFCR